jgi:putative hemolysin
MCLSLHWRGGRDLQLEVMCFVTYRLEERQRITVGSDVLCHLPTGGEAEDYSWKWCALSLVTGGAAETYSWKWCALSLVTGGEAETQLEVMCFVTYRLEERQRITVGSDVLCHLPTGGQAEDYSWKWCALSPTGGEAEDYSWKWCALSLTDWRAGRVLQLEVMRFVTYRLEGRQSITVLHNGLPVLSSFGIQSRYYRFEMNESLASCAHFWQSLCSEFSLGGWLGETECLCFCSAPLGRAESLPSPSWVLPFKAFISHVFRRYRNSRVDAVLWKNRVINACTPSRRPETQQHWHLCFNTSVHCSTVSLFPLMYICDSIVGCIEFQSEQNDDCSLFRSLSCALLKNVSADIPWALVLVTCSLPVMWFTLFGRVQSKAAWGWNSGPSFSLRSIWHCHGWMWIICEMMVERNYHSSVLSKNATCSALGLVLGFCGASPPSFNSCDVYKR